jgi:hypothetical protein
LILWCCVRISMNSIYEKGEEMTVETVTSTWSRRWPCNPSTKRLRQKDRQFKASLGYIGRPCYRTKQNRSWPRKKEAKKYDQMNTMELSSNFFKMWAILSCVLEKAKRFLEIYNNQGGRIQMTNNNQHYWMLTMCTAGTITHKEAK